MSLKMLIPFKVNLIPFFLDVSMFTLKLVIAHTEVKTSRTKKRATPSTNCGVSSVTSVLFQNDYTIISAGAADGYEILAWILPDTPVKCFEFYFRNIHIWDLRKNYTGI